MTWPGLSQVRAWARIAVAVVPAQEPTDMIKILDKLMSDTLR